MKIYKIANIDDNTAQLLASQYDIQTLQRAVQIAEQQSSGSGIISILQRAADIDSRAINTLLTDFSSRPLPLRDDVLTRPGKFIELINPNRRELRNALKDVTYQQLIDAGLFEIIESMGRQYVHPKYRNIEDFL